MGISYRQNEYLYSYAKDNPPELKMHMHYYYEFLYFKAGDASYLVENNIYSAESGDIFVTRPQELHTIAFHSDKQYERDFIQISKDFISDFPVLFETIDSNEPGNGNRIPKNIAANYNLYEYFDNVKHYIINRLPESDAMIKAYTIQFLVKLNSISDADMNINMQKKNCIDDIIEYLTYNISSDITLDFLANKFFVNKYHMCHTFKKRTGLTIKEFINIRKITKAKNLLCNGTDIMSLCYECGFNDYSTFYKTFKKLTGTSPKSFINGN